MDKLCVRHAANPLNDEFCQGKAVVGVDAVGAGGGLEGLRGEPLQQIGGGI